MVKRRKSKRKNNNEAIKKVSTQSLIKIDEIVAYVILIAVSYGISTYDVLPVGEYQMALVKLLFRIAQFSQCRVIFPYSSTFVTLLVCIIVSFTGHTIVRLLLSITPAWYNSWTPWYYVAAAYSLVFLFPQDYIFKYSKQNPLIRIIIAYGVAVHKYIDAKTILMLGGSTPIYVVSMLYAIDLAASGLILKTLQLRKFPVFTLRSLGNELYGIIYPGFVCILPLTQSHSFSVITLGFLLVKFCYSIVIEVFRRKSQLKKD